MKTLPTLRDKKRYMAFEVLSEITITRAELAKEIASSAGSLFGDSGCSGMNLGLLSYDGKYGIIRCARGKTEETRAALACITRVQGVRLSILILGISGSIRGVMEKFIQQTLIKEPEQDNKRFTGASNSLGGGK